MISECFNVCEEEQLEHDGVIIVVREVAQLQPRHVAGEYRGVKDLRGQRAVE